MFLFVTLNWNESYCLRYKQDKLQFTARNCIVCVCVCGVCVCRKLLAAVLAVVVVVAAATTGGEGDVI